MFVQPDHLQNEHHFYYFWSVNGIARGKKLMAIIRLHCGCMMQPQCSMMHDAWCSHPTLSKKAIKKVKTFPLNIPIFNQKLCLESEAVTSQDWDLDIKVPRSQTFRWIKIKYLVSLWKKDQPSTSQEIIYFLFNFSIPTSLFSSRLRINWNSKRRISQGMRGVQETRHGEIFSC